MLVITIKQDEPFTVRHQGVELCITVRKSNGKLKAYIEGPKELHVARKGYSPSHLAGDAGHSLSVPTDLELICADSVIELKTLTTEED